MAQRSQVGFGSSDESRDSFRRPASFVPMDPSWYEAVYIEPDGTVWVEPICGVLTMQSWLQRRSGNPYRDPNEEVGADLEFATLDGELATPTPASEGAETTFWRVVRSGVRPTPDQVKDFLGGAVAKSD